MCNKCGAQCDSTDTFPETDPITAWNRRASPVPTKASVQSTAEQTAAEMMVAARNAQMFQDVRSIVATCADRKARAPYRHVEAQRVLPLLDGFLGEGYTGRVMAFKRALAASPAPAISESEDARWISVDDRTPENGQMVLCVDAHIGLIVATQYEMFPFPRYIDRDTGRHWCKFITHWMPLPAAPIDATRKGGKS